MSYAHGDKLTGTCKFWNIEKGYGFIDPTEGGENIFVHNSDLTVADEKYRALVPDVPVSFTYNGMEEKVQASSVTSPDGSPLPGFASKASAAAAINLAQRRRKNPDLQTGKVKFFDPTKGYGFIIPDAEGDDIYVRLNQISGGIPPVQDDPVEYTLQRKDEETGKKAEAVKVINRKPRVAPSPMLGMGMRPQMGYSMPQSQFALTSGNLGGHGGHVKFFNEDQGFGFIVPSQGGADLHFSQSNLRTGVTVTQGDWVEYQVQIHGGKTWATDVTNKVQQPGAGGFAPQQPTFGYAPQAPMAAYRQPMLSAYAAQSGRETGSVKFFNEEKDFGFIVAAQGGNDLHFSRKDVDRGRALQKGDSVEYDFQSNGRNTCAINITMVAPAPAGQLGKRKAGQPAYGSANGVARAYY